MTFWARIVSLYTLLVKRFETPASFQSRLSFLAININRGGRRETEKRELRQYVVCIKCPTSFGADWSIFKQMSLIVAMCRYYKKVLRFPPSNIQDETHWASI